MNVSTQQHGDEVIKIDVRFEPRSFLIRYFSDATLNMFTAVGAACQLSLSSPRLKLIPLIASHRQTRRDGPYQTLRSRQGAGRYIVT